jgi:hypothetical protein
MKMSMAKLTGALALGMLLAGSAFAQTPRYYMMYSYSDADGVAQGAPSSFVTVYIAQQHVEGSALREIRNGTFRMFHNTGEATVTGWGLAPGKASTNEVVNLVGVADGANLDGNPDTNNFSLVTLEYTAGQPLRGNAGTLPAGWAPGQDSAGAFDSTIVWEFSGPPTNVGIGGVNSGNAGFNDGARGGGGGSTVVAGSNVDGFTAGGGVLAVEMIDLDAKATGNGVLVTWETAMEIDNAGFNVYSQPKVGSLTKLNPILIGAAGTAASYSFADSRPLADGEVRAYYVEDVDVTGLATTLHGPAIVQGGVSSNVPSWDLY